MTKPRQRGRTIETVIGKVRIWKGREYGERSGEREYGWWWAADDCDANGPVESYEEAEKWALETVACW